MVQIARLLFATTFVSIFRYLIVYLFIAGAGNGGEYWGFDGHIEPYRAASQAYDAGDLRFLGYDLADEFGQRVRRIPVYSACDNHPYGPEDFYRMNDPEARHGKDSVRLANAFAHRYNDTLAYILDTEMNLICKKFVYE